MMRYFILILCLSFIAVVHTGAQAHTAVSLDNTIYYIIEQMQARGLCAPLSGARPYTRSVVLHAANEILNSPDAAAKLKINERAILEHCVREFSPPQTGIDFMRGSSYNKTSLISLLIDTGFDARLSAGFYPELNENYWSEELWLSFSARGDITRFVSYSFSAEGGLIRVPRRTLGTYNVYYDDYENNPDPNGPDTDLVIPAYSEPLAHFPFTYHKRWDSSVFFFDNLSDFEFWPNNIAGAYNLNSELTGSLWNNALLFRIGRMRHEWGSLPAGASIAFNEMARPFLAFEALFEPVSWLGFYSLTGLLEYYNTKGIKISSETFQNAYSLTMITLRYKNYLYADVGESVVWPKRFEPGYMLPIINKFMYQNNIGDFDNLAMFLNLKAQYPGAGFIWASWFVDEVNYLSNVFELDRTMWALQGGIEIAVPVFSFSSLKLSYTKVNPYCYTHQRLKTPYYNNLFMEEAYINNGVGMGYYLPPNSDEILVCFKSMPAPSLVAAIQYQLIRHGADYGASAVDGSSIYSELDGRDRDTNPVLRRYFLRDGAYQWMNIIKINAEWNVPRIPLTLFGEAGVVISFFTNTKEQANSGAPHDYSIINTVEYPKSTGIIVSCGVKFFP